jgi:putative nucleotidyltransferase with HDIG domain
MRLSADLYSIYGDMIVRKNVEITPAVVKRIRAMGERHRKAATPLRKTAIFRDFRKVFDDKRFANILISAAAKKEVCDIVGRIHIENSLIFELDRMKSTMPYTYKHALIVTALAIRLSSAYKPETYDEETVARCGLTHDIGKTRIPMTILNKREKLAGKEKAVMRTHSVVGYLLLEYYLKRDRTTCARANLDHHERLDGSGYPSGIKKIGKYSQLISIVDIMDALMTKRPYRQKAFVLRAALDYLLSQAYRKKIDINVVLPLISLARKKRSDLHDIRISKEVREELPD